MIAETVIAAVTAYGRISPIALPITHNLEASHPAPSSQRRHAQQECVLNLDRTVGSNII